MENTQPQVDERDERAWREERLALMEVALGLRDELPDREDRAALGTAILAGEVEDIYQPFGASYHNVTIPDLPAWLDPRIKVTDWAAIHRAGHDVRAVMLARHAEGQARAMAAVTNDTKREDAELQAQIAESQAAWEDWWQGDARDEEAVAVAKRHATEARARADEMRERKDS